MPVEIPTSQFEGLDAIEIKITVREDQENQAKKLLGLEPDQQERKLKKLWIYFYDTANLELFNRKVILRARKKVGEPHESTVKLRGVDQSQDFSKWRMAEGEFKLEGDWVGDRILRSASLSVEQSPDEIDQVANHQRAISRLFSDQQEQFVANALKIPLKFDALEILGPVEVQRWKQQPQGFSREICVECWKFPDGKDMVELSVKVTPEQALATWEDFDHYLKQHGLDTHSKQEAKTSYALNYFSQRTQKKA